jgi:hypothetical protein
VDHKDKDADVAKFPPGDAPKPTNVVNVEPHDSA